MAVDARTEEFQHIEVFDKFALFTNARIDRTTVPKGWYCYDFRGTGDAPGELRFIEESVVVNHSGSILMPEKLELPASGQLDCRLMQATLTDCTGIDTEIESLLEEIDVVTELTKRCIAENSQTAQNQEEYAARYNGFVERYEKAKARLEQLRTTKAAREAQAEAIGTFMFEMQELDTITEFDEKLWLTSIDTVTVHADGRMTFKF